MCNLIFLNVPPLFVCLFVCLFLSFFDVSFQYDDKKFYCVQVIGSYASVPSTDKCGFSYNI
jgi:hypothetical protein